MATAPMRIGDLLISKGLLTPKKLQIALIQQRVTGAILGDTLISLGFVTAQEFAETIADQSGVEYVDLRDFSISEEALRLIPKETARKSGYIPLEVLNGVLSIGVTNPSNIMALDTVRQLTGTTPRVYLVDQDAYSDYIESAYYFVEHPVKQRLEKFFSQLKSGGAVQSSIVPELTDLLLMDGIRKKATDIHLTPSKDVLHVFYRIDGVLTYGHCLPHVFQASLASRIKIMAHLDIAESRLPQDGSYTLEFLNKRYDLRISTVPSIYGENIVIRVLSTSGSLMSVAMLGLNENLVAIMRSLFEKSHGIVLITGPTGSGKTTTLYSCLRDIDLLERNVITVEDPVEYRLNFVRQTEVNEKAGYTFASSARTFMRQDPDVMLLGEIRDTETGQMAVRASITGHLVLSTLHTNDAVTSIPRLLDLGMDKLLLSSSLLAVVAQRLARKICPNCKVAYTVSETEKATFRRAGLDVTTAYRGKGCERCGGSGYTGRTLIAEIMIIKSDIKDMIYTGASSSVIYQAALKGGMVPMMVDGLRKAAGGHTTVQEIQRVAG
ncbi:MAG: ATPase, T2SS/T4P/T4SS family [Desulfuromonadaceae bacterium]|nr:ATPase, T2SS/T4P/T4SS family [Desulfuromonadaceae bacterium]